MILASNRRTFSGVPVGSVTMQRREADARSTETVKSMALMSTARKIACANEPSLLAIAYREA